MDIGVFHNGGTNLPLKVGKNGAIIPDASVREMHQDRIEVIRDQIDHAILADESGFDRAVFTEHHFELTGAEQSPSPLLNQMAVAMQTEDIRLAQVANIISWHDPVRLAEQTAVLDIISDGRVEVGVGRGYQPRENETLGQYWGGTAQNDTENWMSFQEKVELLRKSWTEDLFSHHGEFHSVPPRYTRWHHEQDYGYLEDEVTEFQVEDVIDWTDDSNPRADPNPVVGNGSKLRKLAVFPHPIQDPHPPMWQPVSSPRSIKYAAENGINAYLTTGSVSLLREITEAYYTFAEDAGWPDVRPEYDGEPFAYGWDEDRLRGVGLRRPLFNTDVGDEDTFRRWKLGLEMRWDFFAPFGFRSSIAEVDEDPEAVDLSPESLIERDIVLVGDGDELAEMIIDTKEELGFDGISIDFTFEMPGITGEEADNQLRAFADETMPRLREALD